MNLEGSHVRLNFGDIYYLDGTVAEVDFELEQFYFQPDLRGAFTGWISFQEFGLAPNKEGLWRISSFAEEVPEDEDDEE